MTEILKGYRTYIAAAGLIVNGVTQISDGNLPIGIMCICFALGFFGLREAVKPIIDILKELHVTVPDGVAGLLNTPVYSVEKLDISTPTFTDIVPTGPATTEPQSVSFHSVTVDVPPTS